MRDLRAMYLLDLRIQRGFLAILGVMLLACVASLFAGQPMFAITFMPMVVLLFTSNLLGAIEAAKVTQLFGALPVGRRTVVRAHYLVMLTVVALCSVPWLVALLVHLVRPGVGPGVEGIASGFATVAVAGLLASINIAAIIRWGSRAGAWVAMVVVFGCIGLMVAVTSAWHPSTVSMGQTATIAAVIVALTLPALVGWLCYRWAARTYAAQDH